MLLPWFWPDASAMSALADADGHLPWSALRADPGLLFFVLSRDLDYSECDGVAVDDEARLAAANRLDDTAPWADWRSPGLLPAVRSAVAAAHFAELLARHVGDIEPARAWTGAWLAYAGWLAVGVADGRAVGDCLGSPTLSMDVFGSQLRCWGMSRGDVAWRLSTAWPLPHWARVLMGRVDGTPADAAHFGGDARLQALVQIAIVLAEQTEPRLFLADEFDLESALRELTVRSADLDAIRAEYATSDGPARWLDREWADPRHEPGLADRLRGLVDDEPVETLSLVEHSDRIRHAKLAAVAEFAAGASHEINNPLAVISGHSQFLLKNEEDEERIKSLQSIVRQTRRIHATLTELMYFARPPAPRPEWVELGRLVREAASPVGSLAAEKSVAVELGGVAAPLWLDVDPKQLTIALAALVRNGVEAAPKHGWVQVSTSFGPDRLDIVVEDSGPGPDERSQAHLFDPFYSGRSAGRGRGLGLPAAWRLAREHGGDVRYVPTPAGPTRFELSLPRSAVVSAAQRKTA